jgi:plastocyanin
MERGRARRRTWLAVVAVAAIVILAACGGGGGGGSSGYKPPTGPSKQTLEIKAGNFFFDPKDPTLPAGVSTIKLTSQSGLHTLVFDKKVPGFRLEANSGQSEGQKVDLKPGKYTFYCDIPGHRQAGMEGTLTVQ